MISIMIKSAIVLAVAAGVAGALRRQSAALRHAIWTAGLIGALVVPLCSITLPPWQKVVVPPALIVGVGPGFTATIVGVEVPVQPLASVTATL